MDKKIQDLKLSTTHRERERETGDNNLRGALATHHIVQVQRKLGARGKLMVFAF